MINYQQRFDAVLFVPTKVYVLNGIDVVPHYTERGVYMAPGNVRFLEEYLRLSGAPVKELMLWERS